MLKKFFAMLTMLGVGMLFQSVPFALPPAQASDCSFWAQSWINGAKQQIARCNAVRASQCSPRSPDQLTGINAVDGWAISEFGAAHTAEIASHPCFSPMNLMIGLSIMEDGSCRAEGRALANTAHAKILNDCSLKNPKPKCDEAIHSKCTALDVRYERQREILREIRQINQEWDATIRELGEEANSAGRASYAAYLACKRVSDSRGGRISKLLFIGCILASFDTGYYGTRTFELILKLGNLNRRENFKQLEREHNEREIVSLQNELGPNSARKCEMARSACASQVGNSD